MGKSKAEKQREYRKSRETYNVVFTKEEDLVLKEYAKIYEAKVPTYIKYAALKKLNLLIKKPLLDRETLKELNKIGVNINQIAKEMNQKNMDSPLLEKDFKEIIKLLQGLYSKIG